MAHYKTKHEAISNEVFETYRIQERVKERLKAVKLLATQGYTILDLEGNIVNKFNVNSFRKRKADNDVFSYNRVVTEKDITDKVLDEIDESGR